VLASQIYAYQKFLSVSNGYVGMVEVEAVAWLALVVVAERAHMMPEPQVGGALLLAVGVLEAEQMRRK
jgi:hypothetical protein